MRSALRFAIVLGLACTIAVGLASASGAGDDELVAEFKKYYKKYEDTPTRVEAILALEDEETPDVVRVLVPLLDGSEPEVLEALHRVLSGFETEAPRAALGAQLERTKKPDVARRIMAAASAGGYGQVTPAVRERIEDKDWGIRRQALETLGRLGDRESVPAMLDALDDKEIAVRCAALDALAELRAPEVLEPAWQRLGNDSWQVRASAVAACARVRDKRSIEPLIERLGIEEGRLVEDIGAALDEITDRQFGVRHDAWVRFWESMKNRFEIPTDAELAELREKKKKSNAKYKAPGSSAFAGIDTLSRKIAFVIDVSGSMEQEVVEKDRFAEGDYPSWHRIDIVKTELARTIEGLEPYVEFNIYAFATEVDPWKKGMVRANVLNKSSAASWIERLEAIGGNSKREYARAGLVATANLEGGKTNTWAGLSAALGIGDGKKRDDDYEDVPDTIFFLSDGRPSHGVFRDPDDILREVRERNAVRKVVIHTIGIGEFEIDFLARLAIENGGVFVDLGK